MLRKIFLLVLIFALVAPCAYAKKPTPHTVMRVSDLSLCPTGRSCVDGSGNMKMGAATIGTSGLRDNAGTMQVSNGGGAYQNIGTASASISDAAFGAGWNGVTTDGGSKNAIYDALQLYLPLSQIGAAYDTEAELAALLASHPHQDVGTAANPSFASIHASGGNMAAANRQVVKAWQTGLPYVADLTAVVYGGTIYVCTSSHTAGSTTEPGVGASWETVWEVISGSGMANPMTTAGDVIFGGASGTPTRLAPTVNNDYVLAYNTGTNAPYWKVDSTGTGGDQLRDIVATAPLLVNGAAAVNDALPGSDSDVTFSMAAATGSVPGYLTAADWTTFNSKQDALTPGTSYLRPTTDVDDTPVNGEVAQPVSSNWAYDHAAATDPHAGYVLESLFDAYSVIYADTDNTPARLTVGASTMVGRQSTGGVVAIGAASQAEMEAGAETALRAMSPLRVAQAIAALASTSDTIGWDYTVRTAAPASPVAGKVYRADNDTWDPITYAGTTDYFVLYTGSAYVGIVDLAGNLLIDGIPVSALDVAANVATFLGSADYAAMRTNMGLVISTNVQAYDADLTTWAGVTPGAGVATAAAQNLSAAGGLTTTARSGSVTFNPTSVASGACSGAVDGGTATGVATTDVIVWNPSTDPTSTTGYNPAGDLGFIWAYPTADHVNFKFCNKSGNAIDPGSITINWKVVR